MILFGPLGQAHVETSSIEERRRILAKELGNMTVKNLSMWSQPPIAVETIE